MRAEIKRDVISLLKDALIAVKQNDTQKLKEISDHTLHDASIYQDKYSTSIAVVIYSLSKVYDRNKYKEYSGWKEFHMRCVKHLEKARDNLTMDQVGKYNQEIKNIYRSISTIEKELGMFITEVLKHAQIKKASKIYEHGISIGRTAELLGISSWELMDYVGQTRAPEMAPETVSVKERLEFAKKLFS